MEYPIIRPGRDQAETIGLYSMGILHPEGVIPGVYD